MGDGTVAKYAATDPGIEQNIVEQNIHNEQERYLTPIAAGDYILIFPKMELVLGNDDSDNSDDYLEFYTDEREEILEEIEDEDYVLDEDELHRLVTDILINDYKLPSKEFIDFLVSKENDFASEEYCQLGLSNGKIFIIDYGYPLMGSRGEYVGCLQHIENFEGIFKLLQEGKFAFYDSERKLKIYE